MPRRRRVPQQEVLKLLRRRAALRASLTVREILFPVLGQQVSGTRAPTAITIQVIYRRIRRIHLIHPIPNNTRLRTTINRLIRRSITNSKVIIRLNTSTLNNTTFMEGKRARTPRRLSTLVTARTLNTVEDLVQRWRRFEVGDDVSDRYAQLYLCLHVHVVRCGRSHCVMDDFPQARDSLAQLFRGANKNPVGPCVLNLSSWAIP